MCYGDIDHGRDGYYREWAEEQERAQQEQDEYEAWAEGYDEARRMGEI